MRKRCERFLIVLLGCWLPAWYGPAPALGEEEKPPSVLLAELGKKAAAQSVALEVSTFLDGRKDTRDGWFRIDHAKGVYRVDDASQTATVYHPDRIVKWDLDGPQAGRETVYSKAPKDGQRKIEDWSGFVLQNRMETLFLTDAFEGYRNVIGNSRVELLAREKKAWRFRLTLKDAWSKVFLVKDLYREGMVVELVVDPGTGLPSEAVLHIAGRKVALKVDKKREIRDRAFMKPSKD